MGLSTVEIGDSLVMKDVHRACPIYGGPRGEVLHRQEFYLPAGHPLEGGYEVVACVACGFVFADTVVDQAAYLMIASTRSARSMRTQRHPRDLGSANGTHVASMIWPMRLLHR